MASSGNMARRQVDLHVRAFADRSVEYALRQPSAPHACSFSWIVYALLAASAMLWSAWTWRAAGVSSAVVALLVNRVSGAAVVEESLLVVPSLGVKLVTRRRNGASSVRFIDQSDICAVILNEAITFNDVVYYLAFMVEGQDSMVLAFETFRPRVAVLQQIFHEVKAQLFPDHRKMRLPSSIAARAAASAMS